MSDLCQRLEWDSEFFGYNIARVKVNRLTRDTLAEIDAWCAAEQIDCLYFLGEAADHQTAWLAGQTGFSYTDTRVLWEVTLGEAPEAWQDIRLAVPDDIPALKPIARVSHHDSRFYFDPVFPEESANTMFEIWIEKSVRGVMADAVLVAVEDGQVLGYSAVLFNERGGQMNLLGVSGQARGKGLGSKLTRASFRFFWERDIRHIELSTQGRNLTAQRLYVKYGFYPTATSNWYHRWSPAILAARGKGQ